jgi:hypothetical protein
MTKHLLFVIIIGLRLAYHPAEAQQSVAPFASPTIFSSTVPAKVLSFKASVEENKIILDWIVGENETAYQFEVEKSADGKNFKLAALVFGTDKPQTDQYQFFERAGKTKMLYRIKLVNKDQKTEYSPVVEVNPNA